MASLINSNWLLTVEHCINNLTAGQIEVVINEYNSQRFKSYRKVAQIVIPNRNTTQMGNCQN